MLSKAGNKAEEQRLGDVFAYEEKLKNIQLKEKEREKE